MSQGEVRFNFYWDYAENIRAHRVLLALGESARWMRLAYAVLAAAAVAVTAVIVLAPAGERGELASNLVPLLLLAVFILGFYRFLLLRNVPLAFNDTPDAEHPVTSTVSGDGYATALRSGTQHHPWEQFRGVRETDDFLFFLFRERGALYVPKRAVSGDDLLAIRTILREQLGEGARVMDTPASGDPPRAAASA